MYRALIQPIQPVVNNKLIWKKLLKTKVFAWYILRGVILSEENFAKRDWQGSQKCVFCHHDETINHIFFQFQFANYMVNYTDRFNLISTL
jgi:hypothetical protein